MQILHSQTLEIMEAEMIMPDYLSAMPYQLALAEIGLEWAENIEQRIFYLNIILESLGIIKESEK